ncbi:MAG: oligosaccharide flippase family protein [Acidiphilium sp.]
MSETLPELPARTRQSQRPLRRMIAGYLPGTMIPALTSFGAVLVFTRLLSPAQYGRYGLAFTILLLGQSSLFYAISMAIVRFHPGAARRGAEPDLVRTAFIGVAFIGAVAAAVMILALLTIPFPPKLVPVLWLAVPLLLLRATIATGQAVRRSRDEAPLYCLVEGGQALIGFAVGIGLVILRGPSATSVMLGLLAGAAAGLSVSVGGMWREFRLGRLDRALLHEARIFSAPLALTYMVLSALQYGDRFLVGGVAGAQALGIYVVAWTLVERPTTLLSLMVTTATFPRAVFTLEHEGREAARHQAGINGILLLAVAAPSCIGLMLIAPQLAQVMVGPRFRDGLADLLPIISAVALMRAVSGHVIDHAYHLARRSDLMLFAYGPFAILNLAIDALIIPRYGIIGAAWVALGCVTLQCAASAFIARRVFPLWLPVADLARIGIALIPMVLLARIVAIVNPWLHLAVMIGAGATSYAAILVTLDLGGVRAVLFGRRCRAHAGVEGA